MLEDGAWLRHAAHANAMAQRLASALRAAGGRLSVVPEANGVFVELTPAQADALAARGWQFYRFIGATGYRLMCSWATEAATVDRFAADFATVAGGR